MSRWGKVGKQKIEDAGTLYPKRMETVDDEIRDLALGFMDKANWNDAVMHLETAVRLAPDHIYHRLELAEVYTDLGQYSKAREQCQVIATLPEVDVMDGQYKKDAADLFSDIKNEKDER